MLRAVAVALAALMLLAPSTAMAQSAGDDQYADPFGQVDEPSGSQGEPAPAQEAVPAEPVVPGEPVAPAEEALASQQAQAPALPATGLPAGIVAGAGALMLSAGAALRRRLS
jgi:hypothetical protein